MKRFLRYALLATVLVVAIVAVSAALATFAAEENVIYISDSGNGNGESASSPLGMGDVVTRSDSADEYWFGDKFYKNSPLYAAADSLKSTGGKIVLVGDVKIGYATTYSYSSHGDRDFDMPSHGNNTITITAQGDSKLIITEGGHLNLGGDTVFENMTFQTGSTSLTDAHNASLGAGSAYIDEGIMNRAICCDGNSLVIGSGVKCVNSDSSSDPDYYISIVGADRFMSCNYDTNISIMSGTWGHIYGSNFQGGSAVHTGDANIDISGGTFMGRIIAGAREGRAIHKGNVNLKIMGGEFKDSIYACSERGTSVAGYTATFEIIDGKFSDGINISTHYGSAAQGAVYSDLVLDLTNYKGSDEDARKLVASTDAKSIYYPSKWCNGIEVVSEPESSVCYMGKDYDASGLEIKLSLNNGVSDFTQNIAFTSSNPHFEFGFDNAVSGIQKAEGKYAGRVFDTLDISVISERVIYISDNGTGDGSSASSPLKAETVVARKGSAGSAEYNYYYNLTNDSPYYLNSVLYQAADMLKETGGKIVLVGDVKIDFSKTDAGSRTNLRDFYMPEHKNNPIVITSENNGKLILSEGAMMNLGGSTVFENMKIATQKGSAPNASDVANLSICCNGYETLFGNGITCANETGLTGNSYYPSIAGGERYDSNAKYDTNVKIKSGTYYCVYGGLYGNSYDTIEGTLNLTISGGTYLGSVFMGARPGGGVHLGDANLTVEGGVFNVNFYGSNERGNGFKNSVYTLKIIDGTFSSQSYPISVYTRNITADSNRPQFVLDLRNCVSTNDTVIKTFANPSNVDVIYYPSKWCTGATVVQNPTNTTCFVGQAFDGAGFKINATYSCGGTNYSDTVTYSPDNLGFKFELDSQSPGTKTMVCKYGNATVTTLPINVINAPRPVLVGAQIGVTPENTGALKFVAELKKPFGDGVSVVDYGFIALDGKLYSDGMDFDLDKLYGKNEMSAFGTTFRPDYDMYNNEDKMTYSAVYNEISVKDYGNDIAVVAYMTFTHGGKTYTTYSDVEKKSVIEVANAASMSGLENAAAKEWIRKNVIDVYSQYVDNPNAAHNNVSSDELRNTVMTYYENAATYAWTPSFSFTLGSTAYNKGTTYYGIPYVASKKATFEEFESYMKTYGSENVYMGPVNGIKDIYDSLYKNSTTQSTVDFYNNSIVPNYSKVDSNYLEIEKFFPGCDYSMIVHAWNKVSSEKIHIQYLDDFLPGANKGTIAIGNYAYSGYSDTLEMVNANGSTKMYSAYSQLKPGDVLVNASTSGRSVYVVTTGADGASASSTVRVCKTSSTMNNNSHYLWNQQINFQTLLSNGYIPVTIPELRSGYSTRGSAILAGFDGEKSFESGCVVGAVESNRQILSVNVQITSQSANKNVYDETKYFNNFDAVKLTNVQLSQFDISSAVKFLVSGKTYILKVTADIAGEGESVLVEYSYKKPLIDKTKYDVFLEYNLANETNLAQATIDSMREMASIEWTPNVNFKYENLNGASGFVPSTTFKAGVKYRGVLYATTWGSQTEFMETLNKSTSPYKLNVGTSNGTIVSGGVTYYKQDWHNLIGSHCSSAMYNALQKSSRTLGRTPRYNENLKLVGLPEDLYATTSALDTLSLSQLYGYEALYESYAQTQMGDFMYHSTKGGGHTRFVVSTSVVRDSNGRIDPAKSKITMIEQTDTLRSASNSNYANWDVATEGYDSTWWETEYTFKKLSGEGNSVPYSAVFFRATEFETNETEKPYISLTNKFNVSACTHGYGINGVVESNYPMLRVIATLTNSSGTKIGEYVFNDNDNVSEIYSLNLNAVKSKINVAGLTSGITYTYTLKVETSATGLVTVDSLTFTR